MGIPRFFLIASAICSFFVSQLRSEEVSNTFLPSLSRTTISGYVDSYATWNPGSEAIWDGGGVVTEILWSHADGRLASWELIGTNIVWKIRHTVPPSPYSIPRIPLGSIYSTYYFQQGHFIFVNGSPILARTFPGNILPFAAVGNFAGRGPGSDLMWASATRIIVWEVAGNRLLKEHDIRNFSALPVDAQFHGTGHFNMDFSQDFAWQDPRGVVWLTLMNGLQIREVHPLNQGKPVNPKWKLRGASDFNKDGYSDLLWLGTDGQIAVSFLRGTTRIGSTLLRGGQRAPAGWEIIQARPTYGRFPRSINIGRPIIPSFPGTTNYLPELPVRTNRVPVVPLFPTTSSAE